MFFKNKHLKLIVGVITALMLFASGFATAQKLSRAAPFPHRQPCRATVRDRGKSSQDRSRTMSRACSCNESDSSGGGGASGSGPAHAAPSAGSFPSSRYSSTIAV